MSSIRLAVDAVVEHQGTVLLVEFDDAQFGRHFGLPGGGVEAGEAIRPALIREVREETGVAVTVGRLLLVNEYRPEEYANLYNDEPELRLVFHCRLREGHNPQVPSKPDEDQIGVRWQPIEQLPILPLYPRIGKRLFSRLTGSDKDDIFNTAL